PASTSAASPSTRPGTSSMQVRPTRAAPTQALMLAAPTPAAPTRAAPTPAAPTAAHQTTRAFARSVSPEAYSANALSSFAQVAVGRPVRGEFTYQVPEDLAGLLSPGQRVLVPFGRGRALAFYLGPTDRP